jgi:kumamolisin
VHQICTPPHLGAIPLDDFHQANEEAVVYVLKLPNGTTVTLSAWSISWGGPASNDTLQSQQRWQRSFAAARLAGKWVCCATGDSGAEDGTDAPTADDPAGISNAIGAAGVELVMDSKSITGVKVWNDQANGGGATGCGINTVFPPMPEEKPYNLPVSAADGKPGHSAALLADNAAPASGPVIYMPGPGGTIRKGKVGGTSNASPFSCVKLALACAEAGFTPHDMIGFLYQNPEIFDQVTVAGSVDEYTVNPTDTMSVPTGFGVLNYPKLVALLTKLKAA